MRGPVTLELGQMLVLAFILILFGKLFVYLVCLVFMLTSTVICIFFTTTYAEHVNFPYLGKIDSWNSKILAWVMIWYAIPQNFFSAGKNMICSYYGIVTETAMLYSWSECKHMYFLLIPTTTWFFSYMVFNTYLWFVLIMELLLKLLRCTHGLNVNICIFYSSQRGRGFSVIWFSTLICSLPL